MDFLRAEYLIDRLIAGTLTQAERVELAAAACEKLKPLDWSERDRVSDLAWKYNWV